MPRHTTRHSINTTSEEFQAIKAQVNSEFHDDLFIRGRWQGQTATLVETMEDQCCVGFVIRSPHFSLCHGYSLINHTATFNRSSAQAVKWVKHQAKNNS